MDWTIDYLPQQSIVRATTSGTVTFSGEIGLAADVAMYLRDTGAVKYLVDHRAAIFDAGAVDIFRLVRDVETLGGAQAYLAALVLAAGAARVSGFHQCRASAGRFPHRVFADPHAAMEWLHQVGVNPVLSRL
jgi:hypothetical protein